MQKSGGSNLGLGACTERIGIFKTDFLTGDICRTYSNDTLFVRFGMFNDTWTQTISNWEISQGNFSNITIHGAKRRNLINRNLMGGYDIHIEDLYSDTAKNNSIKQQIIKAIDFYRCGFKINIRDTTASTYARIKRAALSTGVLGTTFMEGNSGSFNCNASTNVDASIKGFQIQINENILDTLVVSGITFLFNFSDTIPNDTGSVKYTDVQRIMMHELGHVFQLRHTNNREDLMASGKITSPNFNNFNRSISNNDSLGLQHLYMLSKLGACNDGGMTDYNCSTNTSQILNNLNSILIYPNPTQKYIYLDLVELDNQFSKLFIQLFSLNGHKILETISDPTNNIVKVDLPSNLSNGMYLLKVFDEKGKINSSNKIIIQK